MLIKIAKKLSLIAIAIILSFNVKVLADNNTSRVLFDQNYGYGLSCQDERYYTDTGVGICSGYVKNGTSIAYPRSSSNMLRVGQGSLIGWSQSPNCINGQINNYNDRFTVESNVDFYACYREEINGWRYLAEGAIADDGATVPCGTMYWISYCNKDGTEDYCYYAEPGNETVMRRVYRNKLTAELEAALGTCTQEQSTEEPTEDYGWRYPATGGDNYSCGEALYITTCSEDLCNYTKISKFDGGEVSYNGTVDRDTLKESSDFARKDCEEQIVDDDDKTCTNTQLTDMRKKSDKVLCYNKNDSSSDIKEALKKYYVCDSDKGYYFDETSVVARDDEDCNSKGLCTRTYSVSCTKGASAKPVLVVTSGIVQSNGYGIIKVKATAVEGKIDSYFVSDEYRAPTNSSRWTKLEGTSFEVESSPGVKYIWVRDSKGNISSGVSGAVIDTVNSTTTVGKLELYDSNGHVQTPSRVVSYKNTDTIKDSKYVKLANDLSKDSEVLADGFNPFDMEYKLEVDSPTISVYATLTSKDAKYVDGYEPRTVNLNYGINTILIKIQNKEGITRTYTILVTRTDNRSSDNTLNDISVNVGNIKFNSNVTDYKIEIPSKTTSVEVNSKITSDRASYVEGYEPGNVEITGDTTVKLIKVMSETGSTRTYVLTFVKEGTDVIQNESLQFKDLSIPGVYIPFESDVSNYSLSVGYETESIDINPVLNDDSAYYDIYIKRKGQTDYDTTSKTGIGLDVGENFIEIKVTKDTETSYYRFTIIRKEFGLDISDDTALKDLKVLGYDIKFKPDKKDYTVRIKQEKSLVITALPNNNRAEVFIRGNDELTGFSTVRVKVVAENGESETYSIDIKKDAFNKTIEIASIIAGVVIIFVSSCIIVIKKKSRAKKDYYKE